jgi:hypothetical protein
MSFRNASESNLVPRSAASRPSRCAIATVAEPTNINAKMAALIFILMIRSWPLKTQN